MSDSSDEEKLDPNKVSPRTILAIQKALTEAEDEASVSPSNLQTCLQHPVPQVVVSSSDEDTRPSLQEESDFGQNATHQSVLIEDSLLGSSSEDELEEVIGERNKAFRSAALQQSPKTEMELEAEPVKEAEKEKALKARESEPKMHVSASSQESSFISPSLPCGKRPGTEAETENRFLDKSNNALTASLEETNTDDRKSEDRQESDSGGKVIVLGSVI